MSTILLHPSGQAVECGPGDTVLAALEKAGYALPNNCRAGACGECRTKVLDGAFDQGVVLDMALSAADRANGFGLMCMAKPLSDVLTIEYGTKDAKPRLFPPREHMPFVVIDKLARTPAITELALRPLREPMRYWPGQYVQLCDREHTIAPRNFSLASAPRAEGEILLQISRIVGGVTSGWVHDTLRPGDRVDVSGPYGTFIGDPSVDTPVLCMAAGSGLAPILALTEAALRRGYRRPVTLLFSARTSADIYNAGLMAYWETRNRNFRFRPTLTQESGATLHGRIPAILPALYPDLSEYSVFIAGNPGFVEDCGAAARALHARDDRIHTERYIPQDQTTAQTTSG
ncbi:MAG: 2Fe-2S iron-sulfur cluster-binding protein [Candidatus Velthaea sp.]